MYRVILWVTLPEFPFGGVGQTLLHLEHGSQGGNCELGQCASRGVTQYVSSTRTWTLESMRERKIYIDTSHADPFHFDTDPDP